jgi:hypothetical protein
LEIVRLFFSAVKNKSIEITITNLAGLSALFGEFGFEFSCRSYHLRKVEKLKQQLSLCVETSGIWGKVAALQGISAGGAQLSGEVTELV